MQYIYPIFEQNRILKKEALTALRDYSYDLARLSYQDYATGILTGCNITAHDSILEISPGILKFQGRIIFIPVPERISYMATNYLQYLKAKIEGENASPEFITYQVTFLLDQEEKCKENEMEFCRFHLRHGAELRDQYKDFFDLETDYDTINPLFAAWGGIGGKTLAPFVTQFFAEEILRASGKRTEDVAFAYACLNQKTGMARSVLMHYVNDWNVGNSREKETSKELYKGLCEILKAAQSGKLREDMPKQGRRKILFD